MNNQCISKTGQEKKLSMAGVLFILSTLFIIMAWNPGWCQEQGVKEDSVKKVDVSAEDLHGLVDLLENTEQRQEFVKHIKTLISIQEERAGKPATDKDTPPPEDPTQTIEALSDQMDTLSEQIAGALKRITQLVHQFPMFFSQAAEFLKQPENLIDLLILLVCTLAGILAGFLLARISNRYIPQPVEQKHKIPVLILLGAIRTLTNMAPYAVSLGVLHGLFELLPVLPQGREFILLAVWVFSTYKILIIIAGHLLSPTRPLVRILPLKDQDAAFCYRWMVRFAKYGGIYYIISEGILDNIVDRLVFFLFYNSFNAAFPIMISIFVYRLAFRIEKGKESPERTDDEKAVLIKKIKSLFVRFWHIPTILYVWIVFFFSVGGYETEFSYLLSVTIGTLIIVFGVILSLVGVDYAFNWMVDASEPTEPKFVGFARFLFKLTVVLVGFFILSYVWGLPISSLIASKYGSLILARFLVIALTIGILLLVMASSQATSAWLLQQKEGVELSQKRKTLVPIINATIKAGALFVALIVVLDRLEVNVAPILAGAGIIGLGVGMGAQSLVKDFINGLFILFQDMIAVGDWAQLGDKTGEVESISLRAVRIRDLSGNVHIIPNSAIDTVTNMTKHFSRYIFDVGVAYRENVDEVMKILEEIGQSLLEDPEFAPNILQPLEVLGLNKFEDSAVVIRARITTRPMKQWQIGREFNRRMKIAFDERGIEIPFPHRTVYMGLPKEGESPPLNIRVDSPSGKDTPDPQ